MSFYERFELLCAERQVKPQSTEIQEIAGVSSPAISGWKNKGAFPKGEVLCRLDNYFEVSTDYLLGLSEVRKPGPALTEEEILLLEAYRSANAQGRFHIIQVCMNEKQEKGQSVIAG